MNAEMLGQRPWPEQGAGADWRADKRRGEGVVGEGTLSNR